MALADARLPGGSRLELPDGPPYPCTDLGPWVGSSFTMPAGDPRLPELHEGGSAPAPPFENLVGARTAWQDPDLSGWLDFLDPSAPNHRDKLLERAVYLHHWGPALAGARRVLDLGCGTGRFTAWLLDQGLEVEAVDPDLRSLWRLAQHARGRPGSLDLHWSTGERLPELAPVDAVVAAEVLCYAEDPARVLQRLAEVLPRGAPLLASVEARWGWGAALDAPSGSLETLLGDGVVQIPGDRWVRTFTERDLRALLADWEIELLLPTHYVKSGPFELAGGLEHLEHVLAWDARLQAHPVTAPWNRAWTVVARRG